VVHWVEQNQHTTKTGRLGSVGIQVKPKTWNMVLVASLVLGGC